MPTPADLRALAPGQVLSDYRIEGILGQGGFGITYRATDTSLDIKVAIKEYYPREFAMRDGTLTIRAAGNNEDRETFKWGLSRFLEEAQMLARYKHPNIVAVRRFFKANGTAYLVMEYCDGESLDAIIKRDGGLSKERLDRILFPLLEGLELIHGTNFLHRDIKPANIYIRSDGSPVLLDFGAARAATGHDSRGVTTLIADGYSPIEQYSANGNQGPWTDIYSLGATLYRAVTGVKPQDSPGRMVEDNLVSATSKASGRYSASLLTAIDVAMAVRPEQRPQSVAKWREMISVKSPPLQAKPVPKPVPKSDPRPLPNRPPESPGRNAMPAILLVAGIVVIFGASYLGKSSSPAQIEPVPTPIKSSQPSDAALGKSRDCDVCPEMVAIPAGSFTMGSPDTEAGRNSTEGPEHKVTIGQPFSVGKFEVTFKEWDSCVQDKGCSRSNDEGWGRGEMPAIHVNWFDAHRYTKWLSGKTGKVYRLLSEAEWEYVARANSKGAYSVDSSNWSEGDIGAKLSHYAWFEFNSKDRPNSVGKKKSNLFGLHDVQGGVMEWTFDCWNESYQNAKADGSSLIKEGNCELRVARGGAWNLPAESLRVSKRVGLPYEFKTSNLGLRVARTD